MARGPLAAWLLALASLPLHAGPIEVLLDGPRHCPRDRAADAQPLDAPTAIARARPMLPDGFCGPTATIDGCEADTEFVADTFRVYFHQYKLRGARRDGTLLQHAYLVLDRVGNCLAHIPGTGTFERAH